MQKLRDIASAAMKSVGMRELFLISGLGLVGYGFSMVYWPAAFALPGAVLVAVSIFGVRGSAAVSEAPKNDEIRDVRAIR